MFAFILLVVNGYIITLATLSDGVHIAPIWIAVMAAVSLERTITVWSMGWRQRILAATLVEQLYAAFLTVVVAAAAWAFLRGRRGSWHAT